MRRALVEPAHDVERTTTMLAALTGMGLSAAAGFNAYIPFLIVALFAKFTDVIVLPSSYAWMESWWAIGIGTILLLTEVTLDKIPAIDTLNDTIQTVIRPAMGGVIFAATQAAENVESGPWMQENAWVGVALGVVVALIVHGGKMAARPVINAATLGAGAPVVSTVEDGASVGLSLIAIFLPILIIAMFGLLVWTWLWIRRRGRERDRSAYA